MAYLITDEMLQAAQESAIRAAKVLSTSTGDTSYQSQKLSEVQNYLNQITRQYNAERSIGLGNRRNRIMVRST